MAMKNACMRPAGSAIGVQVSDRRETLRRSVLKEARQFIWYVEPMQKTSTAGDRIFYEAIIHDIE